MDTTTGTPATSTGAVIIIRSEKLKGITKSQCSAKVFEMQVADGIRNIYGWIGGWIVATAGSKTGFGRCETRFVPEEWPFVFSDVAGSY